MKSIILLSSSQEEVHSIVQLSSQLTLGEASVILLPRSSQRKNQAGPHMGHLSPFFSLRKGSEAIVCTYGPPFNSQRCLEYGFVEKLSKY